MTPDAPPPDRPWRAIWLLTFAAGLGVANLYYAQPLAALMARSLGVPEPALGATLTFTQVGYAAGMLLLVPLGDVRERRGLLVATAAASVPVLLLVAAAPSALALAPANLLLGVTSSLPQLAVPFAVSLAPVEERGHALGTVMGGLLAGILLSRTLSGALASLLGWRATFVVAAVLMAALAALLRAALPVQRPARPLPWLSALASLVPLAREEPRLRRHALVGAVGFASFSVFWSTLAFHLATLGEGARTAGLYGVVGLVGVAAAPIVGRLSRRVAPRAINAFGLGLVLLGFAAFWAGRGSLVVLGLGVALLDAGVQSSHLANQSVILALRPESRNRLNAVYMVSYFAGGALGTAAGAWAWGLAGWAGACTAGALFSVVGLAAGAA